MVIGLIGKIGSGKSECAKYIRKEFDVIYFSCDEIAKKMISTGEIDYFVENMEEFFSNEKLQEECRKKVHPKVFSKIKSNINSIKKVNAKREQLFVIETALPNDDLYNICDKVICVKNSLEMKIKILCEHRNYNTEKTIKIYKSQEYYDKYYDKADYIINNNGTKEELLSKLKEVLNEIYIICK